MSKVISKKKFLKGLNDFKNLPKHKKEKVFNLAWESKNFEIELYWKRAGYFWAFQTIVLAGLFAVASNKDLVQDKNHYTHYIICLGFITALGWLLINKGSKVWQRHWEKVVDILEDYVIGKLYKTNTSQKTFSVSKINELISQFFMLIWLYLLLKSNFYDNIDYSLRLNEMIFDWNIILPDAIVIYIVYQMYFGKGRGRFGEREIKFYRRKIKTN
ncbi:hypothetical protein [Flavobacterium sp. WV_118_3]|uniref:RipA family octameric membrane protein n=1 Tax=Flavobacterium sp. WV_118_3 TaxID=3151764 RepID=UPI003219A930